MLERLARTRSLWTAFFCTLVLSPAFPLAASVWEITLLDRLSDPAEVRQAIAAMTAEQRVIHAWITATLDVAYPLAYGALFIGSACAFYPRGGRYLALAIAPVVPFDLLEGVVQVLALTHVADFVGAKAVLTPLKFALFALGLLATLRAGLTWLTRHFRGRDAA